MGKERAREWWLDAPVDGSIGATEIRRKIASGARDCDALFGAQINSQAERLGPMGFDDAGLGLAMEERVVMVAGRQARTLKPRLVEMAARVG